jgi:hypothetical protein
MTVFRIRRHHHGADRAALPGTVPAVPRRAMPAAGHLVRAVGRRMDGRVWRLALTVVAAVAAGTAGVLAAGSGPAAPALVTGALTWLALAVRRDHGPSDQ